MKLLLVLIAIPFLLPALAMANTQPVELHQELSLPAGATDKVVALTLDACGGGFDAEFAQFLVAHRIQATIFATRKWLRRNTQALAMLKANADLF
ncbi:MAG: polysaccharide deacetylase family protein, partial [Betaproteobacteria bacterium]